MGVIESDQQSLHHIAHGHIQTVASDSVVVRLSALSDQLGCLIQTYQPAEAAVEEIFVNKNPVSTLKLGLARGLLCWPLPKQDYPCMNMGPIASKNLLLAWGTRISLKSWKWSVASLAFLLKRNL